VVVPHKEGNFEGGHYNKKKTKRKYKKKNRELSPAYTLSQK
jgi:hypothetical protein